MRKIYVVLLIALSLAGCNSQPPAKVASIKPTIKRDPPKVGTKPEITSRTYKEVYGSKAQTEVKRLSQASATKPKIASNSNNKQDVIWAWPVRGNILTRFSADQATFKGIDIANVEGTPILAAGDGEVVYSGDSLRGYGNLIIIKHNKNFLTAYAHNRKNMVKEGENVKLGQRIAEMGRTGTDKVKLHFEVRYQGKPIDPQGVLPK